MPVAGVGTRAVRIVHTVTPMPRSPHLNLDPNLNPSKRVKAKIRVYLPQQSPRLPLSGRGKRTTYARNTCKALALRITLPVSIATLKSCWRAKLERALRLSQDSV